MWDAFNNCPVESWSKDQKQLKINRPLKLKQLSVIFILNFTNNFN